MLVVNTPPASQDRARNQQTLEAERPLATIVCRVDGLRAGPCFTLSDRAMTTRAGLAESFTSTFPTEALHAEWSSAGVDGRFIGPRNTRYGLREFVNADPDGIVHRVRSPL